jgi:hypothetical protein
MVLIVYNPTIYEQDTITFTLPYSTFNLQTFDRDSRTFNHVVPQQTHIDSFCFDNPDDTRECEVHVLHPVPPLAYEMLLLTFQNVSAFDSQAVPFGFDVTDLLGDQGYELTPPTGPQPPPIPPGQTPAPPPG